MELEADAAAEWIVFVPEQLSAPIRESMQQVAQSAAIADNAAPDTRHTGKIVIAVADVAHRTREIVDIIAIVAGQTNLLASNATIGAARAPPSSPVNNLTR